MIYQPLIVSGRKHPVTATQKPTFMIYQPLIESGWKHPMTAACLSILSHEIITTKAWVPFVKTTSYPLVP